MRFLAFARCFLPVGLLLAWVAPLPAMSIAGRQNRREFIQEVLAAFVQEDYATLEATAAELREKKDRFPDGVWTLPAFYDALELGQMPVSAGAKIDERLARWRTAFPRSVAVRVVELNALSSNFRNSAGVVLDRSPQRYGQARAALEELGKSDPPPGADWHNAILRLALREGRDRAEFDRLFDRAVQAEPDYLSFYLNKSAYLRGDGEPGDWEAFALEVGRKNLSGEGMAMYSRIAWSMAEGHADDFLPRYSKIEWPLLREGFRKLDQLWPGSEWNLNNFCRFACLFGDRDTARELFARIDEDRWTTNWLSHSAFKGWRAWANGDGQLAGPPPRRLVLANDDDPDDPAPQAWSLCFARDGASLFAGYLGARIVRWDLATGQAQWQATLGGDGFVNAIETSPDGHWLAVGVAARLRQPNVPGVTAVWDLRERTLPAAPTVRLADGVCGVHCLAFSPDSEWLAAGGLNQMVNKHGELRTWTARDWKLTRSIPDWTFAVPSLVFLPPPGRRLAFVSSKGFNVVDGATWEHVYWPAALTQHDGFVAALAASPDGETLVCGTADSFEDRDHPSEVAFWDARTWTRRAAPRVTSAGGQTSLRFSPDGRWLAGGGYDGILRVWDAATGKVAASWAPPGQANKIEAVAFSPDGRSIAVARDADAVSVYRFDPLLKQ